MYLCIYPCMHVCMHVSSVCPLSPLFFYTLGLSQGKAIGHFHHTHTHTLHLLPRSKEKTNNPSMEKQCIYYPGHPPEVIQLVFRACRNQCWLENEIPTYPSNAMHALQLYPLLPSTQPFQLTDLLGKLPASGKPCWKPTEGWRRECSGKLWNLSRTADELRRFKCRHWGRVKRARSYWCRSHGAAGENALVSMPVHILGGDWQVWGIPPLTTKAAIINWSQDRKVDKEGEIIEHFLKQNSFSKAAICILQVLTLWLYCKALSTLNPPSSLIPYNPFLHPASQLPGTFYVMAPSTSRAGCSVSFLH